MADVTTPRRLRAVVYDWDGTLVDSAEASFRCYQRVFAELRLPFERADFARTYSPNWYRTYEALGLARERWDHADALWAAHYAAQVSAAIPGVRDALERVAQAGLRQAVATSAERDRVEREAKALGLRPFLEVFVCKEDVVRRKPDPQGLLLVLERLGLGPEAAAYVGDSPEDVEMARAAGVFSVGVPGGFPNRDALRASRPDVLAGDLGEALERLLGR